MSNWGTPRSTNSTQRQCDQGKGLLRALIKTILGPNSWSLVQCSGGGAWRLGVHGYTWFERRAMQAAVGRGVRWRACSFADRAIALAPCARHEHATGFERLGRQCVANGSSTSESGTRGTGAGSVNESCWEGARRARAAGKHPPGYCPGTQAQRSHRQPGERL